MVRGRKLKVNVNKSNIMKVLKYGKYVALIFGFKYSRYAMSIGLRLLCIEAAYLSHYNGVMKTSHWVLGGESVILVII